MTIEDEVRRATLACRAAATLCATLVLTWVAASHAQRPTADGGLAFDALRRLGAMTPLADLHGEWWRVTTASVLNGTPRHLGDNLALLASTGAVAGLRAAPGVVVGTFALGGVIAALTELPAPEGRLAYGSSGGGYAVCGLAFGLVALRPSGRAMTATAALVIPWLALLGGDALTLWKGDDDMSPYSFSAHGVGVVVGLMCAVAASRLARHGLAREAGRVGSGLALAVALTAAAAFLHGF